MLPRPPPRWTESSVSKRINTGVAVVLVQMIPLGVGIHAVAVTGFQALGLVQIQVPTLTTASSIDGANEKLGRGNLPYTSSDDWVASCRGDTCGIHTSRRRPLHVRLKSR